MSFKKNIFANYASQIFCTLISIFMLPLYIKYMGPEAYGLVGFFAMLQAWFNLLDMGLTPTLTRETARFRGGAVDALSYRRLVRTLEGIFVFVAVLGSLILFVLSGYIAHNWLTSVQLSVIEMQTSIQLMAIIIGMRWMCGLYRGTISGSERLVWLSGFNSIIAIMRFVCVLPLLIFIGITPIIFFSFQLFVAVIELLVLVFKAYRLLPKVDKDQYLPWSLTPIKPVLKFSLVIAFTSSVWVFVTQTDKLVLSKILTLAEYGYFTLAVLVAGGVMVISGPISSAILPRMSKLEAEDDHAGLIVVYRQATQLVAIFAGAASIVVAFFAKPLLWVWTGNQFLAEQAALILILYALGNGLLALTAFPYYLQFAKGDLRLHLVGNVVFVVLLIPTIIWAASQYGGIGAGYAWMGMNLFFFIFWIPIIHHKFEPGLNLKWYGHDILSILFPMAIVGYGLSNLLQLSTNRWLQFAEIFIIGIAILLAGIIASSEVRVNANKWVVLKRQRRRQ